MALCSEGDLVCEVIGFSILKSRLLRCVRWQLLRLGTQAHELALGTLLDPRVQPVFHAVNGDAAPVVGVRVLLLAVVLEQHAAVVSALAHGPMSPFALLLMMYSNLGP